MEGRVQNERAEGCAVGGEEHEQERNMRKRRSKLFTDRQTLASSIISIVKHVGDFLFPGCTSLTALFLFFWYQSRTYSVFGYRAID